MSCVFKHKESKINTLSELKEQDILDGPYIKSGKDEQFNQYHNDLIESVEENYNLGISKFFNVLEQKSIGLFGIVKKFVQPIDSSFKQLDQARKDLGIYDSKESYLSFKEASEAKSIKIDETQNIKPGVDELFQDQTFANQVYEALGFGEFEKTYNYSKDIVNKFDADVETIINGMRNVSIADDEDYDINLELKLAKENGIKYLKYSQYFPLANKNVNYYIFYNNKGKSQAEEIYRLKDIKGTTEYQRQLGYLLQYNLDEVSKFTKEPISKIKKLITPQQEQQAKQLYSQYIEQTGKQDIEGFKNYIQNEPEFISPQTQEEWEQEIKNGRILSTQEPERELSKDSMNNPVFKNLKFNTNNIYNSIFLKNIINPLKNEQTVTLRKGISELFAENLQLASIGTQEQYERYLSTIFPYSKVKDIVYHGVVREFRFDNFKLSWAKFEKAIFFFKNKINAEKWTDRAVYKPNLSPQLEYILKNRENAIEDIYRLFNYDSWLSKEEKAFVKEQQEKYNLYWISNIIKEGKQKNNKTKSEILLDLKHALNPKKVIASIINVKNPKIITEHYDYILQSNKGQELKYLINDAKKTNDSVVLKSITEYTSKKIEAEPNFKIKNVSFYGNFGMQTDELYSLNTDTQYAVFEPEQVHILGSIADIEGFKKFVSSDEKKSDSKSNIDISLLNEDIGIKLDINTPEGAAFINAINNGDIESTNCK